MKDRFQSATLALLGIIALLTLVRPLHAGVIVTQGLSPGAKSWPGSPIVATLANPSSDFAAEDLNGGNGNTSLSQTFTITGSNYLLQTIDIYISGGIGGQITVNLYDLGTAIAPSPGGYVGNMNLFGLGAGLLVSYSTQPTSILQFAFTGADQVYLQAGHTYAFELANAQNSQPIYWQRSISDGYAGGAAYRSDSWLYGTSAYDFAMAVYASATTQSPPAATNQCTVDCNTVFQRIDGFGASSAWESSWTSAQADMFFSTNTGIGLSLLRNHIVPGGTTAEINIMQMAQARGARVWSTPWSPAATFKGTNANGVISVNGGPFVSSANNYQNYANQLAGYVSSMKTTYGVNLYALSMQNEPDANTTNYESCVWTSQQFHDFIPYLYNALSNQGVGATKIILAEDEHWQFNLATNTMSDTNTAPMVGILAAHNYGSTSSAVTNYGKALWETEISLLSGNDSSISNAIYWAGQIHLFLTLSQVNAWHYWWLMNGNSTGNESLLDINGSPAKRMYALGNFSKFIRPNFNRIGVITNTSPLEISAYMDPVSSNFVIVAINLGTTPIIQTFNFTNFTASSVTPWITSSNSSLASNATIAVTSSSFTDVIGGTSVVTFVGRANRAPNTPTNLLPANLASGQSVTPTLQASAFSDPDAGNVEVASEWLVMLTADDSVVFDSGTDTTDKTNLTLPAGALDYATAYNWQVRYEDNNGAWSSYSMSTTFSTANPNLMPNMQPGGLVLSWPANSPGFVLEYATNLDPVAANWQPVSSSPVIIGDSVVFTNSMTNVSPLFFRLKKP